MMKAIIILISVLVSACEPPLLSEKLWKNIRSNLNAKGDEKLSLVHEKLNKFSAYENIKAKVCPENLIPIQWEFLKYLETEKINNGSVYENIKARLFPENKNNWGFWKHLATGKIIIKDDTGISPLKMPKNSLFFKVAGRNSEPHDQMEPFIRCLAHCFDLSDLLLPALKRDHAALVDYLLDADVKVKNDVEDFLKTRNVYGQTPLLRACISEKTDLARVLIRLGADVNVKDSDGMTPAHYAAKYDDAESLQILIENGASINAQNDDGQTALCVAGRWYNASTVQILVQNGAYSFAFSSNFLFWPAYFSPHFLILDILNLSQQQ